MRTPSPKDPRSVGVWFAVEAWQEIRGKDCTIYLEPRGWTCDRGRFLAKLFPDSGTELERSLGPEDLWPRYYFDEDRAKAEIEEWLNRRGQLG